MITFRIGQPSNIPWWRCLNMSDEEIKKFNDEFMREEEVDMTICDECGNDVITHRIGCRKGIQKMGRPMQNKAPDTNVYERQIWNEAIEAAAVECGSAKIIADEIRRLKK